MTGDLIFADTRAMLEALLLTYVVACIIFGYAVGRRRREEAAGNPTAICISPEIGKPNKE